jgi:hypothetical protein
MGEEMSNDNTASCGCPTYWVEHPTHPSGNCPYCEIDRLREALEWFGLYYIGVSHDADHESEARRIIKEALEGK